MAHLTHKGYGRIYVSKQEDIATVEAVIQALDEFEYTYLPDGYIAVFSEEYPKVKYTGKFSDLDMNQLTAACWSVGVPIFVMDIGHEEFVRNPIGKGFVLARPVLNHEHIGDDVD